jgi:hypothetical protein
VSRVLYPRSGHGMSVDIDRDAINATVLDWFDRHSRLPAQPRALATTLQ